MSLLFPWALIFLFSFSASLFLEKRLGLRKRRVLFIALGLALIFVGQVLYIQYYLFPKNTNTFYLLTTSMIILVFSGTFLLFGKKLSFNSLKLPKVKFPTDAVSKLYIVSIFVICSITFLRAVLWPINWYDQFKYYEIASSYFNTRSTDMGIVGIQPGLPMILNYFALFNTNNIILEKQLQLTIFYYFILTILALYVLAKKWSRSQRGGLISVLLLLTCFNFVNFTIFGFKEVIIISLIFSAILLFNELEKHREKFITYAILVGTVLGAMSFIHFTGTVVAFLLIAAFVMAAKMSLKQKIIFSTIALLVMLAASFGETIYFLSWLIKGLHIPQFMNAAKSELSRTTNRIGAGELRLFGINTKTDQILKGKLQAFTQIQAFGFVYWFAVVGILVNIKKIIRTKAAMFVAIFTLVFLFLIINPFDVFNHYASYVFEVSPKYYLLILPFLIVLASTIYPLISKELSRIPQKSIVLSLLLVTLLAIFIKSQPERLVDLLSGIIPLHYRTHEYYVEKINGLSLFFAMSAGATLLALSMRRLKNDKHTVEIIASIFLFLMPFVYFFNNNYNFATILTKSFSTRNEKIKESSVVNKDTFEVFGVLEKEHGRGETVLLLGKNQIYLDYYLLTKHDEYFGDPDYNRYVFTQAGDFDADTIDWIVKTNGFDLPEEYKNKVRVFFQNSDNTLLTM